MTTLNKNPSLATLMMRRLFWIAAIVTLGNLVFVAMFDAGDSDALISDVAKRELSRIERVLTTEMPGDAVLGQDQRTLYADHPEAYAFLILSLEGVRLDGENDQIFPDKELDYTMAGNEWVVRSSEPGSLMVVAKRIVARPSGELRVFFTMRSDPADLIGDEVMDEFIGHVWVPLIPIAFLLIGGTLLLIRRTLAPISKAADWAKTVVPGQPMPDFDTEGLPAEIAELTGATRRAIERLNQELAAEQRRAAEAAHALRTPVAVLVARADSLPPGAGNELFRQDVQSLSRTVTQLLTSAGADRMEVGRGETADLTCVATDVVTELAPFAILHGSEIELFGADTPIKVRGSADAIRLALTNLIENAVHHGGGTPVHVHLDPDAKVTVRDHGPGLPEAQNDKLFEPFWRGVGAKPGGAGLGLAIIDRIQRAHGGTIEASNDQGGGAAFRLTYQLV